MYTGIIDNIPTSNIDIDPCCSRLPKKQHPASSDLLLNAFTASRTGWKAFALTAGLMEIERG